MRRGEQCIVSLFVPKHGFIIHTFPIIVLVRRSTCLPDVQNLEEGKQMQSRPLLLSSDFIIQHTDGKKGKGADNGGRFHPFFPVRALRPMGPGIGRERGS